MKNGYCIKSYDKYFFFVSFIFWLMPFLVTYVFDRISNASKDE